MICKKVLHINPLFKCPVVNFILYKVIFLTKKKTIPLLNYIFCLQETDNWNIRVAYEDMMKEDCYLEPEVIRASLYAARRINNLPLAIRILELVKVTYHFNIIILLISYIDFSRIYF